MITNHLWVVRLKICNPFKSIDYITQPIVRYVHDCISTIKYVYIESLV